MELESEYVITISALDESESLMVVDDDVVVGVVGVVDVEIIVLLALTLTSMFNGLSVVPDSVVLTTLSSLR